MWYVMIEGTEEIQAICPKEEIANKIAEMLGIPCVIRWAYR